MKKQNWKKVISLVAGSLVIALVVSILPGGFLVNAERVESLKKAEELAIAKITEEIDDEEFNVLSSVLKDKDEDRPYYLVVVESDEDEDVVYEVKVYKETGKTRVVELDDEEIEEARKVKVEKEEKSDNLSEFKDFEDFEDEVDEVIEGAKYEDYGIEKPTVQASINELLRDGKKLAITEFKENEDKVEAKVDFKDAKDTLKSLKPNANTDIKNQDKAKPEKDEDNNKELVKKVILSKKQVLLIALKKVNLNIDSKDLAALGKTDKISDFEQIFDIDDLEVILADVENPSVYKLEFEYKNYEYKIEINASSGKILEYKRESLKAIEIEEEDEEEVVVEDHDEDEKAGKGNEKVKNNVKNK